MLLFYVIFYQVFYVFLLFLCVVAFFYHFFVLEMMVVVLVVAKWVPPEWGGLECLAPVRSSVFPIATPVDLAVAIGHSVI